MPDKDSLAARRERDFPNEARHGIPAVVSGRSSGKSEMCLLSSLQWIFFFFRKREEWRRLGDCFGIERFCRLGTFLCERLMLYRRIAFYYVKNKKGVDSSIRLSLHYFNIPIYFATRNKSFFSILEHSIG